MNETITLAHNITLALWALNLDPPLRSLEDWAMRVNARMESAKKDGAQMLILPEYVSEQWMAFAPPGLEPKDEVPWMATQAGEAVERLQELATNHELALLAGTFPVAVGGNTMQGTVNDNQGYYNQAHLFLEDGRHITQNKLSLTPNERNPDGKSITPGHSLRIFTWRGLRVAILICLDIEMPALSLKLARENIDLVLVPSMTSRASGYHRVFGCAKARAVELQAAVAVVGCIGFTRYTGGPRKSYTSAAAVYVPCEEPLGHNGVFAEISRAENAVGLGPLILARDIPIAKIRALRHGEAEVWPGAWSARHIDVQRPEEAGDD